MSELTDALLLTAELLLRWDPALGEIVRLSLWVSGTAVGVAALVGLPLGSALAVLPFPGRGAVVSVLGALMGLPPVVVGLLVYLLLSRSGPLGAWGLLFTPPAMILAQLVLVLPIIISLSHHTLAALWQDYREPLRSLGASPPQAMWTLLWEGRFQLLTTLLAGLGRALAEVGAVLIVGGNIAHHTRVMTTAIALETSKGDLALALALGFILIALTIGLSGAAQGLNAYAARRWS